MKKKYEKPIIEQIETTDVLNMKKTYNLADIPKEFSRVRREVDTAMKEYNEKITYMQVTDNSIRVHLFGGESIITVLSSMKLSPYSRPTFDRVYLSVLEVDLIKKAIEAENSKCRD